MKDLYEILGVPKNASEEDVPVHNRTWYGYSKLLGDAHVQLKANDYLIIRSGHKISPFIYDKAFDDLLGNFDYVNKIAQLMIGLIRKKTTGVVNLGTELKTMYDLAKKTKPSVLKAKCNNKLMPKNVTMNTSKMEENL